MAVAQLYTAVANDVITAARWNNEFGNIYNNGTAMAFPLTAAVSLAGFTITLDAAGATTINSSAAQALQFTPGAKSGTPNTTGKNVNVVANTFTDSNTAGSGTAANCAFTAIQQPTLAATNTVVTTTDAATFYISNSPANGTNNTITNPWALWSDAGNIRLDGETVAAINPYRFTATVAANALTVTLQTVNGAASAGIPISFRNATLATPQLTTISSSASTTLVISSGSTLGTISAVASRIWIGALNNAGTIELFAYNALTMVALGAFPQAIAGPSIRGISESDLITTTAEGGAGTADSSQVTYSTTARTAVAFRWLGYIESTQATAGTWATAPSKVQMVQPGITYPGDLVQRQMNFTNNVATGATAIPNDNTTPLITEGDQYMSQVITPAFAGNVLRVTMHGNFARTTVSACAMTLNNGTTVLSSARWVPQSANIVDTIEGIYYGVANTVAATTWAVRMGATAGATNTFNGASGAIIDNILFSCLCVEELSI